ncbi:hypothetical protein OJ997_04935 [Solirubrobacter phytolaccae]|uniref:Uncharacterized protein n=1 Tax=Solirubrobacter phytolaccae TaxID=1404360 RepID=A0A9X3N7C0_9ACTN|nr:hypothetical protein [Solirubrobacter phytolaccae]MDA0179632.1 hypothetical protein [Solirubrobacter phytolaccae]
MDRVSPTRLASYFGLVSTDTSSDPRRQPAKASTPLRVSAGLVAALVLAVLLDLADLFGDTLSGWLLRLASVWALVAAFSLVADHIAARAVRERRRWRDPPSSL